MSFPGLDIGSIPARKGHWIQTYTGVAYFPADPRVEDVRLADIAHALSQTCRFSGNCDRFYSVAEHSVYVSQCVPPEHALDALMHDAEEAYIGDMTRPVKEIFRSHGITLFDELAALNWSVIAEKFGLSPELPECVHIADSRVLLAEKEQIRGPSPDHWTGYRLEGLTPAPVTIRGLAPPAARMLFMHRFGELLRRREAALHAA